MLINIGFGNVVNMDKVISIVRADAAPVKRMVQVARDGGMAVDATCGRKTKCVLVMDSGHIVLSALQPCVLQELTHQLVLTCCRVTSKCNTCTRLIVQVTEYHRHYVNCCTP